MRAPHQIQQATLSFNFDNALQAEQFERQAHRWTTEQLLPLIEHIFERFNPNHDVITIDRLELDLGELAADSLPERLLNAIEAQLCDTLGHYLSPTTEALTTKVQRFSPDDYQWQQALHFLQTGYLPWSAKPSHPHQPFETDKIFLEHIDELNQFLTQLRQPQPLLARLTYQLSAQSLAQLIEQLAPDFRQIALNQLLCLEKRHHPGLKQTISHHFQRLFGRALEQHQLSELICSHWATWVHEHSWALMDILKSHRQDAQLPDLLCEQLSESQRFALLEHIEPAEYPFLYRILTHPQIWSFQPDKPIIIKPQPVAHIQQQLWLFTLHYLLVERGSRFNRQNYMQTLLEQMAACQNLHTNQLIEALRYALSTLDIDSALQRQMLSLLSTLSTKQSNHPPDIEQFNQMASSERQQWLLHTLLSGDINPLLPRLLEQHHSMLISTLNYLANTPRLWQRLNTQLTYQSKRAILQCIHPDGTEPPHQPTQVAQTWDQQFTPHKSTVQTSPETDTMLALLNALQSGQEHQLQTHWPENQHEFKKLLRWIGQLAAIRQHWAEHYSDPMLLKLTDVIEPAAHDEIQRVIRERRLFAAAPSNHPSHAKLSDSTLRISLWQFTLSYLLLEQESHFNRQSYLQSLIAQMAARRNISQAQLLAAMLKLLQQHADPVLLRVCQSLLQPWQTLRLSDKEQPEQHAMLAIIDHWQQEVPRPGGTPQQWLGLIQALTEADSSRWQTHFKTLTDQETIPLKTLLNRLGQQESVRHRWAERFDDATLQALVGLIEPTAASVALEVIEHPHIFSAPVTQSSATALSTQSLKQSLWEFTFSYLLIERGSEFNRKSYLQSLTRQMAARRNVRQEHLIWAMLQLLHQYPHSRLYDTLNDILQPLPPPKAQGKTDKHSSDASLNENQPQSVPSHLSEQLIPLFQVGLSLWKPSHSLQRTRKEHVLSQLRQFGQQANIRQQWVQQFNDATLLALVRLICPDAQPIIQSVISDDSFALLRVAPPGQTTITHTQLRQMLWAISLNYLFIESGSAFHRQHYLRSLALQLARYYNMQQQRWIHMVLNRCAHIPDWFSALQSLCDPHIPLQPAQTKWLQDLQQGRSPETSLSSEQIQSIRQHLTTPGHHWPFQQFRPLSQRLLIRQLAPDVYPTLKAWLPELTRILANLTLTPNWFYQTLFASHPPQSRSQWLYALLTHLKQIFPDQREAQLVARLQSLMEYKMNPTQDDPWLHSLQTPLELISQWLNSNQQPPAMWIFHQAIREYPTALWQQLSTGLQPRQALLRWIDALDDNSHKQLFAFKYPHLLTDILRLHLKVNILLEKTSQVHRIFWEVLYQRLLLQGYQDTPDHFSQQILRDLSGHPVVKDTLSPHQLSTLMKDTEVLSPHAQDTPHAPIPEALPLDQEPVRPFYEALNLKEAPSSEKLLYPNDASKPRQISGPIAVNNAGIVLAATYIPMLFDRLAFTQDKQFVSQDTQHQALFCLQRLVDDTRETPEYQLVLNKVLCGIPIESPIEQHVPLPEKATEIIESMLSAIIEHWHALGSTSIEGLRSTFIQRNGQLREEDENWQLDVLPGPYDMLLDQLPWSFQTIKYPWMDKPLFVSWR